MLLSHRSQDKSHTIVVDLNRLISGTVELPLTAFYARRQDVDLYYVHRIHPKVPVETQAAVMLAVKEAGLARHIGVSEFSPKNLEAFHSVCPVTTVQQEWSLINRDLEEDLLPACRRLGIGIVAYSPLSRSILSDEVVEAGKTTRQLVGDAADVRAARYPRLNEENLPKNAALARGVRALAKERGLSLAQLSLAWVASQGDDVVPIPGTTKISHLEDNAKAMGVILTEEESALVRSAVPADKIAGARFTAGANALPHSTTMITCLWLSDLSVDPVQLLAFQTLFLCYLKL